MPDLFPPLLLLRFLNRVVVRGLAAPLKCAVLFWTLHGFAQAEMPPAGPVYAWYHDAGIRAAGAAAVGWENAVAEAPARSLARVVGRPGVVRVETPTGRRATVHLSGGAALWQTAGAWGTITGPRTIVVYGRVPAAAAGVLVDGSTRAGSVPVRREKEVWRSPGGASEPDTAGKWEAYAFMFGPDAPPLSGLILGANVATQQPLECDLAEVLVYPRALSEAELGAVRQYLRSKWGEPAVLPAEDQPRETQVTADSRVFRTVLRRNGEDGVHTYRIPGLATTPKGTLIAVFDARNKSGADLPGDIDVAMMRSTDDGATWEPMRRIIDYDASVAESRGNGVGDPAVLVDRSTGAIFVAALWSKGARAWAGSGPGMTPEQTGQLVIVKSTDDGLSWSAPRSITPQIKNPEWRLCFNGPGNGIQTRDGTLVFPAQFKEMKTVDGSSVPRSVPHSCFIFSRDGGENWKIVPAAIPDGVPTSESAVAELEDGSLLLSMRNESRAGVRAWARWQWNADKESGAWGEPWFQVSDPTCMASLIRHPHGEWIFSNPNHAQRRVALTVRSSTDGGRVWSDGRLLEPGGAMYSSLSVLRDGRIGVLYESADSHGLVFARFPLDWVLEGASRPDVAEARVEATGKFGWWPARHAAKLEETRAGGAEILFFGDSITQGWENAGRGAWNTHFAPLKAANYGFSGDSTQHVLWRLQNGEVDGIAPKAVVLLIGTNNARHGDFSPEQIAGGVRAILDTLARKCPATRVLLLGILPRGAGATDPYRLKCEEVNRQLPSLADGSRVHFFNLNSRFLAPDGSLPREIAPDSLHLSPKGYQLFAEALEPELRRVLSGK